MSPRQATPVRRLVARQLQPRCFGRYSIAFDRRNVLGITKCPGAEQKCHATNSFFLRPVTHANRAPAMFALHVAHDVGPDRAGTIGIRYQDVRMRKVRSRPYRHRRYRSDEIEID
jgi:hypothetical protein